MLQHRLMSLIDQSGGNPLFLLELLDHTEGTEDLPDSVEALVSARIDRLDLELRRLLRYSAVVGVTFDQDLVAETAGDAVPRPASRPAGIGCPNSSNRTTVSCDSGTACTGTLPTKVCRSASAVNSTNGSAP